MRSTAIAVVLTAVLVAGAFATGTTETTGDGIREYDWFYGFAKGDYPQDGTIFGDWLEEETGVRINFEFLVGDLQQKIGLIAASGDYPDAINPRNQTQTLLSAGAFIELDELIEEHGPNIQALYEGRMRMLEQPDGNIYWLPTYMPYGDGYRPNHPTNALYVQKAVLESWDYEIPGSLEEATEWLIDYAEANPEINGHPTKAYTALNWSWRSFPLHIAPQIYTGHANDGTWVAVDKENGRWVAWALWDSDAAYRVYKLYNDIYLAGFYDTEAFVMDYDQYLARLSTGSVLAFHDQSWQFRTVQEVLLEEDQDRWYVPLPVALEGYEATMVNPPQPQAYEGIGITVDAEDPEGLMEYFNFLADFDTMKMRRWGREGIDYMVDDNGLFYRTPEQIERWQNSEWVQREYGAWFWHEMINIHGDSIMPDGINAFEPNAQPSVWRATRTEAELQVLQEFGAENYADYFPPVEMDRTVYFPANFSLPRESEENIVRTQIGDVRSKYVPLLVMADEGEYDDVWAEYLEALDDVGGKELVVDWYQEQLDARILAATGQPNR